MAVKPSRPPKEPRPNGRPPKYSAEKLRQAQALIATVSLGVTLESLAKFFDVSYGTIRRWKEEHKEFGEAIEQAQSVADDLVERALFQRAVGCSHPETHVSSYQGSVTLTELERHYPPEPGAAINWLKNRRPAKWRDRVEHTGPDGSVLHIELASADLLRAKVRGGS